MPDKTATRPCPRCGELAAVTWNQVLSSGADYPTREDVVAFDCPSGCEPALREVQSTYPTARTQPSRSPVTHSDSSTQHTSAAVAADERKTCSSPPPLPTVFLSWAHRANPGVGDEAWKEQILRFAAALRASGIDTEVDLYHMHDADIEWSQWGPRMIAERGITVAAVNAAWRERFEGTNDPTQGAGAAAEGAELRGRFDDNQAAFRTRLALVILPGAEDGDVPGRLKGIQRYTLTDSDSLKFTDLLRRLTGRPQYLPPPLGELPLLPPETLDAFERRPLLAPDNLDAVPGLTESRPTSVAATSVPEVDADELAKVDIAVLESALRQFPKSGERISPQLAWYSERRRIQAQLQRLQNELAHQRSPSLSVDRAAERFAITQRLGGLLDSIAGGLVRINRCWLTLAIVPSGIVEDHESWRDDYPGARVQRVTQVEDWKRLTSPMVAIETYGAVRAAKRVIFPGEAQQGVSSTLQSSIRRVELYDDGSGVAAGNVAEYPRLVPGTGVLAVPGYPGEVTLGPEAYLPVRRVRLEMWLLTMLELLVDHIRAAGADPLGSVWALARLELPNHLEVELTHGLKGLGVRFLDEHSDSEGNSAGEELPVGSRELALDEDWPTAGPLSRRLVILLDRPYLVRAARLLAAGILEYASVEQTVLMQPDGFLNPSAGSTDNEQQVIRHHAKSQGLSSGSTQ